MPCPTCDHTLTGIGYGMFHCPRCGTLVNCPTDGAVSVPAIVARCRAFEENNIPRTSGYYTLWRNNGIPEAIHLPGDRP